MDGMLNCEERSMESLRYGQLSSGSPAECADLIGNTHRGLSDAWDRWWKNIAAIGTEALHSRVRDRIRSLLIAMAARREFTKANAPVEFERKLSKPGCMR